MHGDDIRRTFLAFFEERDHPVHPSSSLIPPVDSGLLLTTAGMVQFRRYFMGLETPPHPRATSAQKAFRTTDIEEVGDQSHQTFFEMLGNFSFGEYFKKEAIGWAWELATQAFGLDPDRLWATVYKADDEAEELWKTQTPIPHDRIQRLGKEDNFWAIPNGPGGPNSEIFYDRGPAYGVEGGPAVNDVRYLEFYNLVFMQYEVDEDEEPVRDLPMKSVDTGFGLERAATVIQEAPSSFETDLFLPILERAEQLTGAGRDGSAQEVRLLRILADHSRATTFLLGDAVAPSNEGRGYIVRRLLRRALTAARQYGYTGDVLPPLCEATIARFGNVYPELTRNREGILEVARREEQRFSHTLDAGLAILEDAIEKAKGKLSGEVAFRLHDTYGFPLDITLDVARNAGLEVDTEEFERLMTEQRTRSRETTTAEKKREQVRLDVAPTESLAYDALEAEGKIVAIVRGVEPVPSAAQGDEVDVVLTRTPFYPEGGGQVGDRGVLETGDASGTVIDTQAQGPLVLHRVRVSSGEFVVGADVAARVDPSHRAGAARAHTATHMLHHTLRDTLGEHVRQHGSLVEPGRLRFDFSHFSAVDPDSLVEIEETVNRRVGDDDAVNAFETSYREAIDRYGAMAFFEEKYGDVVRVVEIGNYSYELCGGTHVPHTGRVGFVKLLGEGSIGSNLRRVEALTGIEGLRWVNARLREAERAAEMVRVPPDELVSGIERLIKTQKDLEKAVGAQQRSGVAAAVAELAESARELNGAKLVVEKRPEDANVLRDLAARLRDKLGRSIVILGTARDGRANLVAAVSKDLGVDAREILKAAATRIDGNAGGKPDLAMGGGRRPEGLDEALAVAEKEAEGVLGL
jgi:alanyl-tRNA synthetase